MIKESKLKEIIDIKDFMKDAKPATEFNKVTEELRKEASSQLINYGQLKRDRDWSILGSQVVGAEVLY